MTEPGAEVGEIREVLADSPTRELGAQVYVTGPAGVLADFAEAFGEIDGILLLVALGVVLVILLIVYRSPVLPFLVLLTSILALGAASFVIYQLAANDVITLNGQSQGILFILAIGATTDYSLLLVARFREELRRNEYQVDAMRATLKGTLGAILASGGTVILGVMTLLLSELNSNRGLGPVAAVGIAFAMLAALTFLPAVLVMLGRKAFWPVRPTLDLAHPQAQVTGFWARVAATVDRKPRVVLIASSAVLLGLCAFVPSFKAQGVPQSDFFLVSVESTEGQDALARHFPAGSGSETLVVGPQELADEMTAVINANAGVASVVPQVAGPPGPGAQPIVVDGNVLLQVTLVDQADSVAAEQTVEQLRSDLDAVSTEVLVGGTTAIQLDTQVGRAARPAGDHPRRPAGDAARAGPAAARDRGTAAAARDRDRVVRGDHRAGGDRVLRDPRPARRRCVGAPVRVRVPGSPGRGLQHLPDDPRPGGDDQARQPGRDAARPGCHGRGDHECGHRAGGHVQCLGPPAAAVPVPDRVHRRGGRADRHLDRPLAGGALIGDRDRAADLVAQPVGRANTTSWTRTRLWRSRSGARRPDDSVGWLERGCTCPTPDA